AERGRAIRRQRAQWDVPALIADPLLNVAAGARHLDRLGLALEQDDVIGEPAEAAEHHVFVAGQLFTRAHRGVPLALEDRYVVEQFSTELLDRLFGLLLGGNHHTPHATGFLARAHPKGSDLMRCKNAGGGTPIWRL